MEQKITLRNKVFLTALAVTFSFTSRAGFVAEFFAEQQAMANVTKAGAIEAASVTAVTGGGFVFRTPRKEFVPFAVSPPSLRSGCGGIDVFLGAFSIPSREEFVSFLRSVGTALPGLAFQLALQTMAPDLNEQVSRFTDLIRSYTNRYTDSCEAAQALLDASGTSDYIRGLAQKARNSLRSSGAVSDQSAADKVVRDNGEKAIENTPTRKDASGHIVDAAEMNLTWTLLTSGRLNLADSSQVAYKELLMSLVGTTVYRKEGSGADAVIRSEALGGLDMVPLLFETNRGSTKRYRCDEATKCLNVTTVEVDDTSVVDRMKKAATNYRRAIQARDKSLVTDEDIAWLVSATSVPLIDVLNKASLSRYQGIADNLVNIYVEAAAYESILNVVDTLASDVKAVLANNNVAKLDALHIEHVKALEAKLVAIRGEVSERSQKMGDAMVRAAALVNQLAHIEKSLETNDSLSLHLQLNPEVGAR